MPSPSLLAILPLALLVQTQGVSLDPELPRAALHGVAAADAAAPTPVLGGPSGGEPEAQDPADRPAGAQDDPDGPVDPAQARLEALAREIEADLERMCGREFRRPVAVRATDGPGFVAYARAQLDQDDGRERLREEQELARLFGLVPGDLDLEEVTLALLEEQVGGFYDPPTGTFYVMEGLHEDVVRAVMSHELTHALDDQYHDLDALHDAREGNVDAQLALHSLVEGSAMVVMQRWLTERAADLDMTEVARSQSSMSSETLDAAPPFLWRPLLAPYFQGQAFLQRQSSLRVIPRPARERDVRGAFLEPPRSMEQVLHPSKYWDEERRDEPTVLRVRCAELPEGWVVAREETLGELHLANLTEPFDERTGPGLNVLQLLGLTYTNEAATGWDGDRCALLRGPDGARFASLFTIWDDEAEAEEFEAALRAVLPGIEAAKARGAGHEPELAGLDVVREGARVRLDSWTGLAPEAAASLRARVTGVVEEGDGGAGGGVDGGDAPDDGGRPGPASDDRR